MRKDVGRNIEREREIRKRKRKKRKRKKRKSYVVIFNYFYMNVLETIV